MVHREATVAALNESDFHSQRVDVVDMRGDENLHHLQSSTGLPMAASALARRNGGDR